MKCPKCHYLSFEPEPRCRNCGYDLELADADLQITLEREEPVAPLADLELRAAAPRGTGGGDSRPANRAIEEPEIDESGLPSIRRPAAARTVTPEPVADGELPPPRPSPPVRRPAPTTELPLFVQGMSDSGDAPLVKVPAQPRPPVAVQRRAPDSGRGRAAAAAVATAGGGPLAQARTAAPRSPQPAKMALPDEPPVEQVDAPPPTVDPLSAPAPRRLGTFGRDLLQDLERLDRRAARSAPAQPRRESAGVQADAVAPGTRLTAAGIDLGFLGTIAGIVFWLTLRWCGLTFGQAASLPVVPFAAFVLLVVIGYLLMFTAAGGQTIGKMACGIRVTDALDDGTPAGPVTPRQACLRALLTVPSVLAFGAGFLPALVGEGRAFHDRLTQTRVVRA